MHSEVTMAEVEPVERKDATERRVYNLPASLLERLRAYQVSQGISSEAEAARRLLDAALQMRDKVSDILHMLDAKFREERDLRVLASEVLTKHALVTSVAFDDGAVTFNLKNGERGQITANGTLYEGDTGYNEEGWSMYQRPAEKPTAPKKKPGEPSWDLPKGGSDLDDDMPF